MSVIVKPSRPGSIVAAAFAGLRAAERTARKKAPQLAHPKNDLVTSEPYLRLVAALPCINCGRPNASQAAHLPPEGKSIKVSDRFIFPLCIDERGELGCHSKYDRYILFPREQAVQQGLKWARQTLRTIFAAGKLPKALLPYAPKKGKK